MVGLGQVGLRLFQELQRLGVAVVGVERDAAAPNLRIARTPGIPVVVAHGGDRAGQHEAIAETRSLLPLGITRDVTGLSATYVVARLLGTAATAVVVHDDQAYVDVPGKPKSLRMAGR